MLISVSRQKSHRVAQTKPLKLFKQFTRAPAVLKTKDGLDIRSVLSFLVCLCLVLVLYFAEVVPPKHILEQAQHVIGRLSDPSLVRDRAKATFEDTVALVNPAGVDLLNLEVLAGAAGTAYYYGMMAAVDDEPCREKFPNGCLPFHESGGFCHAPSGECR